MKDKNDKEIKEKQLVLVRGFQFKNGKYFYIEEIEMGEIYVKRVNKDFSFNRYDKDNNHNILLTIMDNDEVEIIEPLPVKFKEELKTLHFL